MSKFRFCLKNWKKLKNQIKQTKQTPTCALAVIVLSKAVWISLISLICDTSLSIWTFALSRAVLLLSSAVITSLLVIAVVAILLLVVVVVEFYENHVNIVIITKNTQENAQKYTHTYKSQ